MFDPFAGSGIAAMEALKHHRRAIVCDLIPVATEITRLTIKTVKDHLIYEAFKRVKAKVKQKIESLYLTPCRKCGRDIVFDSAIWDGDDYKEIRYQECPYCFDTRAKNCPPTKADKDLVLRIEKSKIKDWYPTNRLYYPDGRPFKEKQQYESLDQVFTKRNLQALAWLMSAIEDESNVAIRDFLKIAFTSMVHLCSRMVAVSNPSPTSHHTAFSSTGWTQHSYWSAPTFMEQNVWSKFDGAINGHQGLLKAKAESNSFFKEVSFAHSLKQFLGGNADVHIHTGSCLDLMDKMPDASIDYIFTDPPYDASVQYGELAYLWVAWLQMDQSYLERLIAKEIIRNEQQHKDFEVYHSLIRQSFQKMFRVLKPKSYLTVTFHNPTFKVRNATIRAGVFAGFEFQHIHHQPLGQLSAKSILQPFGSAQGDFYLRFYKPPFKTVAPKPEEIDEVRFEKIAVDTTIGLLAERAEPTPYTIIINYIDPVLARHGFFGSLKTGLDVSTVLKKHLGEEFILLPAKIGSAEGKLWWFKDPSIVAHLDEIPLSERVEQTVYRKICERGKVTFTEVWDAVSTKFPNSLTSDSTSILDALKIYARKVPDGSWLLKPEIQQRVSEHSEIIGVLALIGKKHGNDIWIGRREQSERDSGLIESGKRLRDYITLQKLKVNNSRNQDVIENIDLLWVKDKTVTALFEVESTTTMTSALLRGSNVDPEVDKFMVIPEERETEFSNKMTSPLFRQHFESEGWKLIYFDTLKIGYAKHKANLDILSIAEKKTTLAKKRAPDELQGSLF